MHHLQHETILGRKDASLSELRELRRNEEILITHLRSLQRSASRRRASTEDVEEQGLRDIIDAMEKAKELTRSIRKKAEELALKRAKEEQTKIEDQHRKYRAAKTALSSKDTSEQFNILTAVAFEARKSLAEIKKLVADAPDNLDLREIAQMARGRIEEIISEFSVLKEERRVRAKKAKKQEAYYEQRMQAGALAHKQSRAKRIQSLRLHRLKDRQRDLEDQQREGGQRDADDVRKLEDLKVQVRDVEAMLEHLKVMQHDLKLFANDLNDGDRFQPRKYDLKRGMLLDKGPYRSPRNSPPEEENQNLPSAWNWPKMVMPNRKDVPTTHPMKAPSPADQSTDDRRRPRRQTDTGLAETLFRLRNTNGLRPELQDSRSLLPDPPGEHGNKNEQRGK